MPAEEYKVMMEALSKIERVAWDAANKVPGHEAGGIKSWLLGVSAAARMLKRFAVVELATHEVDLEHAIKKLTGGDANGDRGTGDNPQAGNPEVAD